MHADVSELRDFYATPLGSMARRLIGARIRARWPSVTGEAVLGLGFATPYLAVFRGEARVLGALMPAGQGVLAWPSERPYRSLLVREDALPLADSSVDRLLVVHCLETSEQVRGMLRELWRVLRPEGHLLLVVPNRRGPWARLDTTPFGQGRPYSRTQLDSLLRRSLFSPAGWTSALMMPPIDLRLLRRHAPRIERWGTRLWPAFAGVNLVEARKELIAPIGRAARVPVGERVPLRPSPAGGLAARGPRQDR